MRHFLAILAVPLLACGATMDTPLRIETETECAEVCRDGRVMAYACGGAICCCDSTWFAYGVIHGLPIDVCKEAPLMLDVECPDVRADARRGQ